MIFITNNILNDNDLNILTNICNDFDNREFETINPEKSSNYYNRLFINDEILESYYKNLFTFLKENIKTYKFNVVDLPKPSSWINKVVPETNKNDAFHKDMSYLTTVTYLNDDFENGCFEYMDKISGEKIKINPEINKTLIMDETLLHRVSPVTNGNRFSLITFFQFTPKEKKTLL